MKKIGQIIFILICSMPLGVRAQGTTFFMNGYGRAVVANDKLDGNLVESDSTSQTKAAGGYTMFDLGMNLDIDKRFRTNAILRVRNEFGIFWGQGASLEFRQLSFQGVLGKGILVEGGDVYIGMTPYTAFNPEVVAEDYQSDLFQLRRDILEYESFVRDNQWRLQGVKLNTTLLYEKSWLKELGLYAFGVRTDVTNNVDTPDRLLTGFRLMPKHSEKLSSGLNYIGMLDVPLEVNDVNYAINTVTGELHYKQDMGGVNFMANAETGLSDYNYTNNATDTSVAYSDHFFDVNLGVEANSTPLSLNVGLKDVGPLYASPAAQTRRIQVSQDPSMFPEINNASESRGLTLYDRMTQENIYNRSISPVQGNFMPQYSNIQPYGDATPNRKGLYTKVKYGSDTSELQVTANAMLLQEIIGEGVTERRDFLGLNGGIKWQASKTLDWEKALEVKAGLRMENTSRDGVAEVDLMSNIIDLSASVEVAKSIHILAGGKLLLTSGNEYLASKDEFNGPVAYDPVVLNSTESVLASGLKIVFSEFSHLNAIYYQYGFNNKDNDSGNYSWNQVYLNYTIKF